MSTDWRQDTINKRKFLHRSDAVVGDDDNKIKPSNQQENFKKRTSTTSQSKDSYTDMAGVDLLPFIENTLHKNSKDREFLLDIEKELKKIIEDANIDFHYFPEMSSYNRMLVHRVAAFFGLIHNVDQNGTRVVVSKRKNITRIPDITFDSLIKHSNYHDKYPCARRNVQSFDESTTTMGRNFPRTFRSRFYTSSGINNAELNRERRAHSFEAGDWNAGNIAGMPQHFYGGEALSSNCSSSASSSAIPAQMQSIHLPIYQHSAGPFINMSFVSNEAGMLSPSNASTYSEPVNPPYQPIYYGYKPGIAPENLEALQFSEKEEDAAIIDQQQQRSHPHIPSLFSLQPQLYSAPQQQQYIAPYQPQYQATYFQYQPLLVSTANIPNQFNASAAPIAFQNYYPMYQPQTLIQPHPLLEENNTRHVIEQFSNVNLNSEQEKSEVKMEENIGKQEIQNGKFLPGIVNTDQQDGKKQGEIVVKESGEQGTTKTKH